MSIFRKQLSMVRMRTKMKAREGGRVERDELIGRDINGAESVSLFPKRRRIGSRTSCVAERSDQLGGGGAT